MTTKYDGKCIADALRGEVEDTSLADAVAAALAKHDGQKVSKRLATTVQKALGEDFRVFYDRSLDKYGFSDALSIWGGGIEYQNRAHFTLAPNGETFDHAAYLERNARYYGAAQERNAKRTELLADPAWCKAVAECVNTINETRARLEALIEDSPDRYDIEKLAGKV